MIIIMIINAKARHSVVNKKPIDEPWIVDHVLIMTELDREKKLEHIRNLCSLSGESIQSVQRQLTLHHDPYGRFIDVIKRYCKNDAEIICMILDNFTLNSDDIQSLAHTSGLRLSIKLYLANLPTSEENLAFLNRCLNKETSIGAFCWTKKRSLNLFGPTETIHLLRDTIIPAMESEFQWALEELMDDVDNEPLVMVDRPFRVPVNREEQTVNNDKFLAPFLTIQMASSIFFLCAAAFFLSALPKREENDYVNFRR